MVSPWPYLIVWYLFLAQAAIFISSPGPYKFCFARAFWIIATNSVVISSKAKGLTGLYQNQNFEKVAHHIWPRHFRSCLNLVQKRLWNLKRHMNITSRLEWKSSHAGELISQCRSAKLVPSGYMCLLLLTQNWMLVDGWFIARIRLLILQDQNDSLQRRAKLRSLPASNSHVGQSSDEWPWKFNCREGESTLPGLSSRLPIENFPIHRQNLTDSVDSDVSTDGAAATRTSRDVNEPITFIPKNNRLLWK